MLNHVLIILTGQTNSFVISDETLPFTFMTYNNLIMLRTETNPKYLHRRAWHQFAIAKKKKIIENNCH